jgi:hypothetical protein
MKKEKILILNDTRDYHGGCQQIYLTICYQLAKYDLDFIKSETTNDFSQYKAVILNGEGTMHDNAPNAIRYLNMLKRANEQGVKTLLVNSVWQNMAYDISFIDYISVREVLSKEEIKKDVDVHLDLSYNLDVPYEEKPKHQLITGNRHFNSSRLDIFEGYGETEHADLFNEYWFDVVNKLRHTEIYLTGKQHEMYAACKAKCKFVILAGNTHKNEGLMKTAGVEIPVLPFEASKIAVQTMIRRIESGDFEEEYNKLFDFMEKYPKLNLKDHI